jgi:hypothetical protein
MMVPRSYTYSKPRSPGTSPTRSSRGASQERPSRKPSTSPKGDTLQPSSGSLARVPSPSSTARMPPSSKPVVIPQSRPTPTSVPSAPVALPNERRDRRQRPSPNTTSTSTTTSAHRPDGVIPSVAALLAVTSIPPPNRSSRRRHSGQRITRRISVDELMQEWRQEEVDAIKNGSGGRDMSGTSSSYGSPLDILLERPWEHERSREWDLNVLSSADSNLQTDSDDGLELDRPALTSRSTSTESMPSLEADDRSLSSLEPPTPAPASGSRSLAERREKKPLASLSEDCVADHPLLPTPPASPSIESSSNTLKLPGRSSSKSRRSSSRPLRSFKSNLTASFAALANAAKSFSNFAAPSIPPDDFLSRGLLSQQYASEMRPKPMAGPPTPALRRYLNPSPAPASATSPGELIAKLHEAMLLNPQESFQGSDDAGEGESAPMIQMTTYNDRRAGPSARSRRRASSRSGDEASNESVPWVAGAIIRQREPRENSDFLRVIVLEMNMRRGGKLDSKAAGRAKIWLPPRASTPVDADDERKDGSSNVPPRWVGISADD